MFPFKARIEFDRSGNQALYIQLSNQIIELIKSRTLVPNTKLPSSRLLAEQLEVHRKTVVASYEELILQGWVESIPKKGTYVTRNLPILKHQKINSETLTASNERVGFQFLKNRHLEKKTAQVHKKGVLYLNDGIPDVRLAPIDEIARNYRRICSKKSIVQHLSYGTTFGNEKLRVVLAHYLNSTRGLHITKDNVLITRGSQMGIWLSSRLLVQKGNAVIVGDTNYGSANASFLSQGGDLLKVGVDENGIITSQIEGLCKKRTIKAVYITSHHHHPTTVVLSANRRIHLLNLAKEYRFAIIEDDYDYDFNFNRAPILPLASHDANGNVIYIGSFCKSVAPVFRVGYMVASKDFVVEAAKTRGIIDRQGDAILELTFADFIKSGDLDRHIRKVLKIYKQRRDYFCNLLKQELGRFVEFEVPIGGMAVWMKMNAKYSWKQLFQTSQKHQLVISDYLFYNEVNRNHSFLRLGFAKYELDEIREVINRLKIIFTEISQEPLK